MKRTILFGLLLLSFAGVFQSFAAPMYCVPPTGELGDQLMQRQAVTVDPARARGLKKVLFMRANFPDDPSEPISQSEAELQMQGVNQYFQQASYGLLSMTATVTPVLTMPQTKIWYRTNSQTFNALLVDARAAAKAAGFDTAAFDLDSVSFVRIYDDFNGNANVGAKGVWLQSKTVGTAAHEFGHNLGLFHANTWNAYGDSITGDGYALEYGNVFDIMGLSSRQGQFNAYYKNLLGWIPNTNVLSVTSNGVYRLESFDVPSLAGSSKYALSIKKDALKSYWIEARKGGISNAVENPGVLINWSAFDKSFNGATLLDATPSSALGVEDAPLSVGRTLADEAAGVFITPLRKEGDAFDVAVNIGNFSTNRAPTLTVNAVSLGLQAGVIKTTNIISLPSALPGVPVTFLATALDADKDSLAYFWDFGDGTVSSNTNLVVKSWPAEGDYRVRCMVTDMKGGLSSASVLVKVGSPKTWRISGKATQAGRALGEVRISLDPAHLAYTDSDGQFTLTGLTNRDYVLTAAKPGFVFTPATLSLSLTNQDLGGADFAAKTTNVLNNTPLVQGIAPLLSDLFAPGSNIPLKAAVTDDGRLSKVQFFEGANLVGDLPPGVTNFVWSPAIAGDHLISAKATDENGAIGTAASWPVRVISASAANNDFQNAATLNGSTLAGFNVLATSEQGEPRHGGYPAAQSVWFNWTAPVSAAAVINVSGQIQSSVIAVYSGETLKTLTPLAAHAAYQSNQVSFSATAGATYRIAVDLASGGVAGSFLVNVITTAAPVVSLQSSVAVPPVASPGVSLQLTATASDPDGSIARVEFYNGTHLLAVLSETPYTLSLSNLGIGAYNLKAVAFDNLGATTEAVIPRFRIPPVNDDFSKAILITGLSNSIVGTNDGAATEPGEPAHGGFITEQSVWYKWKAPARLGAVFYLRSANQAKVLAVYEGTSVANLSLVASNLSASAVSPAAVSFNAEAGAEYMIAVDDAAAAGGEFQLDLITTALPVVTIKATPALSIMKEGSAVQLDASASDPDGSITLLSFYDGKMLLASNASANASLTVSNLGVGTHLFTAKARDDLGGIGTSPVIKISVPAKNDDFANRQTLQGTNFVISSTNDGASKESKEPDHAGYKGSRSVWYQWTAPSNLAAVFTLSGDINYGILAAYEGSTLAGLTNVASAVNTNATGITRLALNPRAGATYMLAVDDASLGGGGAFDLALKSTMAPSIALTGSLTNGSLVDPGATVTFTATASDPDGEVVLVEFFERGKLVASFTNAPYTLTIPNLLEGGVELTARATDNDGAQRVTPAYAVRVPPENDDFTNATVIASNPAFYRVVNTGASVEPGEPLPASLPGGHSLWWKWTAPTNGTVWLSTDGSDFDTIMVIYTGSALTNIAGLTFDDDGGNDKASRLKFDAQTGKTYFITVDGYDGAGGTAYLSFCFQNRSEIRGFKRDADGTMSMQLLGPAAATNLLEVSTNLVTWEPLVTRTNFQMTLDFKQRDTNEPPYRFFRNRRAN